MTFALLFALGSQTIITVDQKSSNAQFFGLVLSWLTKTNEINLRTENEYKDFNLFSKQFQSKCIFMLAQKSVETTHFLH